MRRKTNSPAEVIDTTELDEPAVDRRIPGRYLASAASTIAAGTRMLVELGKLEPASDRRAERHRRAALAAITSILARAVNAFTILSAMALTIGYLGAERYGLWATLTSVIAMMTLADLGIGNGLLNAIATSDGRDDRAGAARYTSTAFFLLLALGAIFAVLIAFAGPRIPWRGLFHISSDALAAECVNCILILGVSAALMMPLAVVQRVQMGYQEGYASNLWQVAGNLLGFFGLLVVVYFRGNLSWLVLAVSMGPVAATAANWLVYFVFHRPYLLPRPGRFEWPAAREIAGAGFAIFSSQIGAAVLVAAPSVVAGRLHGLAAAAILSVPQRIFGIFASLNAALVAGLWPAYAEAQARGDTLWIRKTLFRSLGVTIVLILLPVAACVAAMPLLARILTQSRLVVPFDVAAPAALLAIAFTVRTSLSMIAGGCGRLAGMGISLVAAAALALWPSTWAARPLPLGAVPGWIALCEFLVIAVLVADIRSVIRIGGSAATAASPHG